MAGLSDEERQALGYTENWEAVKDNAHGDRKTELVVIGIDYDQSYLEELLDTALVSDEEWEMDFRAFADPFAKYMVV